VKYRKVGAGGVPQRWGPNSYFSYSFLAVQNKPCFAVQHEPTLRRREKSRRRRRSYVVTKGGFRLSWVSLSCGFRISNSVVSVRREKEVKQTNPKKKKNSDTPHGPALFTEV